MIKVSNLSKIYGTGSQKVEALKNINLEVEKGDIFGIIGFSGAGKSSLVRCLNLLEKPTAGTIFIGDQEMTAISTKELRKARTKIGMIFQHFNLLFSRTVFANIAFPLEIAGTPKKQIKERVAELLALVGLSDKSDFYPAQLSGGQKQRVGIARALANNPQVLLCDEATSALDPQTTKSILQLLADINQKLNLTIVLITHEMQVIKEICDKVAVLEDGRIIEQGRMIDIFTNPQTKTAKNFVSSIFSLELPENIKLSSKKTKIIRIIFVGESAGQPIISDLVKKFNIEANIISGNIEYLKNKPFGTLLLEMVGENAYCDEAINYLCSLGLGIEVIDK